MSSRRVSFFDLDGTLVQGNVVVHYLFYARNDPRLVGRVRRLLQSAVAAPLWKAIDLVDRRAFNDAFYRVYEGLSEDRLVVLGEELFDEVLRNRLYPGARDLVEGDRELGHEPILVTGAIEPVARPVARHLGIERVAATRLEFGSDGKATGALEPPVMAGPEKARWVRNLAATEDVDLEASRAYADDASDIPLLSSVGRPAAVNPDLRLRATARAHGWPIVRLEEPSGSGDLEARVQLALASMREATGKAVDALSDRVSEAILKSRLWRESS